MSAELLRGAAAKMRAEAEATRDGDEVWYGHEEARVPDLPPADLLYLSSWHPAVALAVADWVERVATAIETGDPEEVLGFGEPSDARAVARAYLGETP